MRPDTFADYFEKVQWAENVGLEETIDHQVAQGIDQAPIYETEAEVRQDPFTRKELDEAISRLKNNKTPGPNRVTSELIKLLEEDGRQKLLDLLNRCWENEELFEEMNQADLAVIYKKGPTDKPENYRPIALLNIGYKLMASMIQVRLSDAMDNRIDPSQFGFRKGKSTAQPIHIYRRIQEIHEEAGLELVTILLDWEKAFDKINQRKLVIALRRMGVPEKVVRVIEAIYRNPKFSVKEMGKRSTERRQRSGIRQGCPLSPYLFIMVMTVIMRDIDERLTQEERNILNEEQPRGANGQDRLLYADDTLILASSNRAAEILLHKVQEESDKYNMKLNQKKCVLLGMNSLGGVQYIDGEHMPVADRAPYLGTNMSARGNPHFEISTRIAATTITLNKLDLFWKKAPVSTTWKLRVHDAIITSKLLYGLESASLTKAEYERLNAFQIKALRKMLGIKHSYRSHVSNQTVMETANLRIRLKGGQTIRKMSDKLKDRQVKFMAHMIRSEEGDLTKTCAINNDGTRLNAGYKRTGRPRIKWYDQVMDACIQKLILLGILLPDWSEHMRHEEAILMVHTAAIEREI
jgi:hypothetical protein